MKDIMIDLETLGLNAGCVVTQLGASYFDRYTGELGCEFIANISIESCMSVGLKINPDTLNWWLDKKDLISWLDEPLKIKEVLETFSLFYKKGDLIWSHNSFDIPILKAAYMACNLEIPFHYRDTRDLRTIVDVGKINLSKYRCLNNHNALDDCIFQIQYCSDVFKKLKEKEL